MKLNEILHAKGTDVYRIDPEASLADVVQKLVECGCGSLLVCDGDRIVGIITERDILRACADKATTLEFVRVSIHMTTDVVTGNPEDDVSDIMGLMTKKRIRHLPILEDGKLAGIISIGDVVKAQYAHLSVENRCLKEYIQC